MKSRRWFVKVLGAAGVLWGVAVAAGSPDSSAAAQGPDGFIRKIGKEAIDSLTAKGLSDAQRQQRFREILERTFDIRVIARFTLGRYWRRASDEQKAEYVKLFEDFIVQAYAARFKDYNGEKFVVGQVQDVNDREQLVRSKVMLLDGRTIPVHWRVRGNGDYRVVDVVVEGVSMAITQRDEFSSIINQSGGKVSGLLVALRKKTGKE